MDKLSMQTTNIVDENIKRIGELFPNCLTDFLVAGVCFVYSPPVNSATVMWATCIRSCGASLN